MNVQRVRSVLKDWVSREEIDRLASEKWWVFLGEVEATENTPYQKIWTTTDRKKAIHYIDDSLILIRYLQIKGEQPGEVADDIRASLDVYDKDEIRQMVESATQSSDVIDAIYIACVAAPQLYDEEYFQLFEDVLSHPDPEVRRAAIFAMSYVPWPQFNPLLEHVIATDPEVRTDAEVMLQSLEQTEWKGTDQ